MSTNTIESEFVAVTFPHLEGQGWIVPVTYLAAMDTDTDEGVDNFPGAIEFSWVEDETRESYAAALRASGFALTGTVRENVDAVIAL